MISSVINNHNNIHSNNHFANNINYIYFLIMADKNRKYKSLAELGFSHLAATAGVRRKWKVNILAENEELEGYERTSGNVNHYDSV